MIPITKPFLPPKEIYLEYLEGIWTRNWLTNNGPLLNAIELKLKEYLNINHLLVVGNGTIALQIAIRALELKGEIITTPFSYVATTSSIVWENCTPIFVDIDSSTFNIDPLKIEKAITPKTSAILATHVYGNPCDVIALEAIAKKHRLKVIYDAAHGFGVKVNGKSIFDYGDISVTSFHATKVFHMVEGGGVFTKDPRLLKKMAGLRNFGHSGVGTFDGVGVNGKNSEFHAAMGLSNLTFINDIINKRRVLSQRYDEKLQPLEITRPQVLNLEHYNYAYYPIVFLTEDKLLAAMEILKAHEVFTRRYFYPALSTLNYVHSQACPIAEDISKRVLCLPLYYELSIEEVDFICRILLRNQNESIAMLGTT